MKIRKGFVSNSSSSSFVVDIRNWKTKDLLISEEQLSSLLKYNFAPCSGHNSMALLFCEDYNNKPVDEALCLGFTVSCNEDDVVEFLLKKKIPFKCSGHYGHYSLIYDGTSDYVLRFGNFGLEYEAYGKTYEKYMIQKEKKIREEVPIKEWFINSSSGFDDGGF